jgi:hypothetical protein
MYSKVANFILSNKHNVALAGEKHQVIYLDDGTYNPAVYSGPGTNLQVRLTRGDEPLSAVDKMAQAHDIRYLLSNTEEDVVKADETMINKLNDVRTNKLDYDFNINQAELIRLKYYANKLGVPTSFFTTFGHGDSQAEQDLIPIAEKKLQDLEQEGYGKIRPKRLYKDDKGYYNKNSNSGVKQYIKTGSIKSVRDLYMINLNNPKAVPKPRVKKEGDNIPKDKPSSKKGDDGGDDGGEDGGDNSSLKMIPQAPSGRVSTGVPSSKQEVINAYNQGVISSAPSGSPPSDSPPSGIPPSGSPPVPPQPPIEPAIETESYMPVDNTPEPDTLDVPNYQLEMTNENEYIIPSKEQEGDNGVNIEMTEFPPTTNDRGSMPSRGFDDRPFRYGYYPEDTKDEGVINETKDDIIPSGGEIVPTGPSLVEQEAPETNATYDMLRDQQLKRDQEVQQKKSIPKKETHTHFSTITSTRRQLIILMGETKLNDEDRMLLNGLLDIFPKRAKRSKNKIEKNPEAFARLDALWSAYTASIKTDEQGAVISKYRELYQGGFGVLNNVNKNGLNTSDIKKMSKKIDGVILPVIASDELLELKKSLSSKTKLYSFIMNLDPSDKPGSHWVAVIIDNIDKYVGYYDSLCIHPTKQILKDIKQLVKSVDPVHMFKFKFNTVKDQSNSSGKCGMYAMGFLHNIMNGMNFKKASGYMNHDYKEHSIDDMFKGFGYI